MRIVSRKPITRILLAMAVVSTLSPSAFGQNARLQLKNLAKLNAKAAAVNEVVLDGALLQMAVKFLDMDHDPDAAQVKEIMANMEGIYVENFEFDQPNQYSQSDVDEIRSQLAAPRWSRLVESRSIRSGENAEVYVMRDGEKIGGVAILVADPRELTVVNIVGGVDLARLDKLDGNFGIHLRHRERQKKPSPAVQHEEGRHEEN